MKKLFLYILLISSSMIISMDNSTFDANAAAKELGIDVNEFVVLRSRYQRGDRKYVFDYLDKCAKSMKLNTHGNSYDDSDYSDNEPDENENLAAKKMAAALKCIGETPITIAIKRNDEKELMRLLDEGADPCERNGAGEMPIDVAFDEMYLTPIGRILRDRGGDPDNHYSRSSGSYIRKSYRIIHALPLLTGFVAGSICSWWFSSACECMGNK